MLEIEYTLPPHWLIFYRLGYLGILLDDIEGVLSLVDRDGFAVVSFKTGEK